MFHIDIPSCCERGWRLVDTQQLGPVSRSWVECKGCATRMVLTVSRRAEREHERAQERDHHKITDIAGCAG